jgi:predicted nicotinamide N-methyase
MPAGALTRTLSRLRVGAVQEELVIQDVELPRGALRVLQPRESAELPDDGPVEWAPLVPYWSVLWRSGVALGHDADDETLGGKRVVELGCGLGVPSLAAARAGATVLATDAEPDAVELVARTAELNDVELDAAVVDWTSPAATEELAGRGPFDLVLAADVLYERPTVARMLSLLPRLAPAAWLGDPARPTCEVFLEQARERGWDLETVSRGVIDLHRIRFR